jgi:ribosomal protein S18 acetylase RimI-like enzyme
MDYGIREALPAEFDDVGQLTVDAYTALLGSRGLHGYTAELLDVKGRVACGAVFVAVQPTGELLGAVGYVGGPNTPMSEFDDEDACGIRMLAVAPSRQRAGAGRALVAACIERGCAEQRRRVVLHTLMVMTPAQALYEQLGFARSPARDILIPREELDGDEPLLLMAYERLL